MLQRMYQRSRLSPGCCGQTEPWTRPRERAGISMTWYPLACASWPNSFDDLKTLGVRLSIDDFGTGYSSLSRLPRFPVDALKIDRIFVSNMNSDHDNYEIVRLIIMLAHSIGLKVVAEGTETEEQIAELKRLGCEMAQGYFYSPPIDPKAALRLLLASYQNVLSS